MKIKDNMILAQETEKEICSFLKKKFKIKKLSEQQLSVASDVLSVIMANEESENWLKTIKEYCENPVDKNQDRVNQVLDVASRHQVETYMAGILYASRR
jgi:hypothetical protein